MKCGSGNRCLAENAIDCGKGLSCEAGQKCSRGSGCVPKESVDCGAGAFCPFGKLCVNGGVQCMTQAEIQEQAALVRSLANLRMQQRKEDAEDVIWLKNEQARLAKEAEKRRAAEEEAAGQRLAIEMRLQKDAEQRKAQEEKQQAADQTTITIIRPGTKSSGSQESTSGSVNDQAMSPATSQTDKNGVSVSAAPVATAAQIGSAVNIAHSTPVGTAASVGTPAQSSPNTISATSTHGSVALNPAVINNQANALTGAMSGQQTGLWSNLASSSNVTQLSPNAGSTFAKSLQPVQDVTSTVQSSSAATQILKAVDTGTVSTATSLTKFYESPAGQTIADASAEAGSTLASKQLSSLGDAQTALSAVVLYRQGNYLGVAQVAVDWATVKAGEGAGGYIGAEVGTLVGVGPIIGARVGTAAGGTTAQLALDAGDLYVAPVLGNIIYNANPGAFMPSNR